ncbi:hypothetical protein BT96DRAFT_1022541 [Gymnopus androsaceus JB14]|uniref:Uncharacterized protein n=1 Tax=Gymnopus androsaceus JB14 TaxID=1447944 RepID=A0A6A4HBA5_9AGAR|nr:hypothetical protein BT96DRAFT_1022541 [Gymnopus androsaceus JB14]
MREADRTLLPRILGVGGATTSGIPVDGGGSFLAGPRTEDRLLLGMDTAGVWKDSTERAREAGRLVVCYSTTQKPFWTDPNPVDNLNLIGRLKLYAPSNFAEIEEEEESEELDPEHETTSLETFVQGEDLPEVLVGKVERGKISDELAALGYYARSWKPSKGWLLQGVLLATIHLLCACGCHPARMAPRAHVPYGRESIGKASGATLLAKFGMTDRD